MENRTNKRMQWVIRLGCILGLMTALCGCSSTEVVKIAKYAAKEAFSQFLDDASMDSRQIYFVNQVVEYVVHNGLLKDLSVLQEPPFTDKGSVVELFSADLNVWNGIRETIDRINANAMA